MNIVEKDINELVMYENNPRKNDEAVKYVAESISQFGFKVPVIVDKDNVIVAGHTRVKAARKLKLQTVPCIVADDLTPEQIKAFRLADNKVSEFAEWDLDLLNIELDNICDIDMAEFGFADINVNSLDNGLTDNEKKQEKIKLADRFLFPPLSVLNTRRKEWQERKSFWYNIGLKNELSRENMKGIGNISGSLPGFYQYKEKQEAKLGYKITRKEFIEKYLNDFLVKNSLLKRTNTGALLSVFDPVLCELMYYWFCPDNGTILDPFSGGSVRGIVAKMLGHSYTGIDLREEQINANYQQAKDIFGEDNKIKWICGNSLNAKALAAGEYDFIFSCPPYFNLEIYSDNPQDLSNMEYAEFLETYRKIIEGCVDMLKENRFACFVVGDVRDRKTGFYRNFVSETIAAFEAAGAILYNEIILVTPVGSVATNMNRIFQSGRKVGKVHQNILVFYKGNPKKIREIFKEINIAQIDDCLEE